MIQGFNHNIKYRDIIFHIQTEDFGEKLAQIVTHVFIEGNIIATVKSSYVDVVNVAQVKGIVRQMMEKQHKKLLKDLISGGYEKEIDLFLGPKTLTKPDQAIHILEQQKKTEPPHISENKQKSILDANKEQDAEATLDQLILSFLDKENR